MRKNLRFVGLDVHKDSISVAVAENGREPARLLETIPADEWLLLKVLDRLGPKSRLRVCYEAGPTGYGLARRLNEQGICCVVVAPSLVPAQKNRRIKTDRRDAVRLAHFLRSGDLVEVSIPEAQTEAMRDLERAREDADPAGACGTPTTRQVSVASWPSLVGRGQMDAANIGSGSKFKNSRRRHRDVCCSDYIQRWSKRWHGSND